MEHRDRLARFGVEHPQTALSAQSGRIVVFDTCERDGDLVSGVLTSMGARRCGRSSAVTGARGAVWAVEVPPR